MPRQATDSGNPQAADGDGEVANSAELRADPQLVDIARLMDSKRTAVSPETAASADADEDDSGDEDDDLSQLAEHGDESPADPEADPEEDGDDDESDAADEGTDEEDGDDPKPLKGLTPEAQHAFNRFVKKEKGRRRELESEISERDAELERLRAENAALQTEREPEVSDEPALLSNAKSVDEVLEVQAKARKFLDWAEENIELLRYKPEEVEAELRKEGAKLDEFSEEAMAKWLLKVKRNAREVMDAAPRKMQRFERKSQFETTEKRMSAEAEKLIPWLRQPKSPEMTAFNEVITQMPELKKRPNWKALVAAHVEGLKVLRARAEKAAAANRNLRTQATRRPSGDPAPVAPAQVQAKRHAAAFSKVMKGDGGNINDIARLLDR